MALKIFGHTKSTCTRRVATVCKYLAVPYQLIPVDLPKGAQKAPEFLEKQPFGQVPYLDDEGFVLFESRAMARYIAAKFGQGKLIPQDLQGVALFEQACSIEGSNFDVFASAIAAERVFKPMRGGTTDAARVQELEATLDSKLDGYERILSKQKYLAGNEITLADLFHLPYGSMLATTGTMFLEDTAKRPHLAKWWKELSELPAWQAVKDGA